MLAVGEQLLGTEVRDVVRYVTPFAGGVGCHGKELCGALSGGIAVIGGLFGRRTSDEDDALVHDLACRFRERFVDELGVTRCQQVRAKIKAPGGMVSSILPSRDAVEPPSGPIISAAAGTLRQLQMKHKVTARNNEFLTRIITPFYNVPITV